MIKYIILAICVLLIVSQSTSPASSPIPAILRPAICSMSPVVRIGNFEVPNTKATTGYFYNCKKSSCQAFNITGRLNVTKNFFLSLQDCQASCPCKSF